MKLDGPLAEGLTRSEIPGSKGYRHRNSSRLIGGVDSARLDDFGSSWTATPVTPDEIIRRHLRILQARSREMAINDPYMKAFIAACRRNIVGPGVNYQSKAKQASGKVDQRLSLAMQEAWKEWGRPRNCDVTGTESWRSIELSITQSLAIDGEAFVKIVEGSPAGDWGVAVQLIDPVTCPVDYDVPAASDGGNFIRHGIEFTSAGKPVAYYFLSDNNTVDGYVFNGRKYTRIPADEMIHIFRKEMIGQKRGLPWAVSGLFRMKRLKGFEDNAAMNAEVGAGKMGVIEWDEDKGPEADEDTRVEITADGGKFVELPSGAHLTKWDPSFPDGMTETFSRHLLRGIAAGIGMQYHELANDLTGVSYSSIRAGVLNDRERWKEDQKLLIESLHEEIHPRWTRAAFLRGLVVDVDSGAPITATATARARRGACWQGRRWEWVDPQNDTAANTAQIQGLVKSPQEVISESGGDPEQVLSDIAHWYDRAASLGIPDLVIAVAMGQKVTFNATPQPEKKPDAGSK